MHFHCPNKRKLLNKVDTSTHTHTLTHAPAHRPKTTLEYNCLVGGHSGNIHLPMRPRSVTAPQTQHSSQHSPPPPTFDDNSPIQYSGTRESAHLAQIHGIYGYVCAPGHTADTNAPRCSGHCSGCCHRMRCGRCCRRPSSLAGAIFGKYNNWLVLWMCALWMCFGIVDRSIVIISSVSETLRLKQKQTTLSMQQKRR